MTSLACWANLSKLGECRLEIKVGMPTRVLVISRDWNVRALIAAQLQHEFGCPVDSADSLRGALERLILRAAVVVIDWRDLETPPALWSIFRAALRDARLLVLASPLEADRLQQLKIDSTSILFRPFTIAEIAARTHEFLTETEPSCQN